MATIKQKLALQKITENHGNVSRGMLEAGYSPNTAKKPSNLTLSKGWNELLDQQLPDKELIRVHKEGLKAIRKEHKIVDRDDDGKPIYDFVDVEDYGIRFKYLQEAYELKGRHKSNEGKGSSELLGAITIRPTAELMEAILGIISRRKQDRPVFVSQMDSRLQPHNGTATQGSNGVHRDVEQA